MSEITWTRDGRVLELNKSPYFLVDHDGFGMVETPRIEDSGPLQDGTTDRGIKLPPRDLVLYIRIYAESFDDYYAKREELLRWFTPSGRPGIISLGSKRAIAGYPIGGLGFEAENREGVTHSVAAVIHCSDPLWYDPEVKSSGFYAGGGQSVGVVPMSVPFTVGTSVMDITSGIDYRGSYEAYPVIRIYGPIDNPKIVNELSGAVIEFANTTIPSGDYYEINLAYGYKTVKDKDGNNQTNKVTEGSSLASFSLLPVGSNPLTVTGSSISGTTYVEISWNAKFIGV
jgi:hypothetical protein